LRRAASHRRQGLTGCRVDEGVAVVDQQQRAPAHLPRVTGWFVGVEQPHAVLCCQRGQWRSPRRGNDGVDVQPSRLAKQHA
jgi:hypothetical protein